MYLRVHILRTVSAVAGGDERDAGLVVVRGGVAHGLPLGQHNQVGAEDVEFRVHRRGHSSWGDSGK